jgi:CMP-N,N'-diacetyllegionaminic acid synthase
MSRMAEVLALIPARGGSKSVPRKNVLPIGGKPLIAYTIEHALACRAVTRTVVSTDDDEIAAVASEHGAEVPFRRPAEFATDDATDLDVFRHALNWFRDRGYMPDLVMHLRATTPIRRLEILDRAVEHMLQHPEADSLRSVSLSEQTPYKMWRIEGQYLRPVITIPGVHDAHSMPRQSLPESYWQNGYVDIVRPRAVLSLSSMCGECVIPFVVEPEAPDLDYPDQIPQLEQAVLRGPRRHRTSEPVWKRHPA